MDARTQKLLFIVIPVIVILTAVLYVLLDALVFHLNSLPINILIICLAIVVDIIILFLANYVDSRT